MMTLNEPPSVLSSPQRRCQVLLMLYLPGVSVTPEYLGQINDIDDTTAREDIAEINHEIQRFHRLTIVTHKDGSYRIEGTTLDRRLALLHWLRRALRLCPHFIHRQFTPLLKAQLKLRGIARTLYDDTNLQALINRCGRNLNQCFDDHDAQFLRLYLQYCLLQHHQGQTPEFNHTQQHWTQTRVEYQVAEEIIHHWQRRVPHATPASEHLFLALLFMMLRAPDQMHDGNIHDRRLQLAIFRLIARFQTIAGRQFSNEQGLREQLYNHLSQALNRCVFGIGIDNSLTEEIDQLYPRLMRTTRTALREFEESFNIHLPHEEASLVAVIFGAWLMQEGDLHEKQVVLLTASNPALEQDIEQQLRELTLLPLNIKRLAVAVFQKEGAPKGTQLIITPYATSLPLVSPPLIHAEHPLSAQQCQHISQMLDA